MHNNASELQNKNTLSNASGTDRSELLKPRRASEVKPPCKAGKIGWALLWLMGIPIPVLLLIFLVRGCS
ncbi:MAG: hypothetical protein JJU05_16000 [Verrucomicrobia bacterium]|nr:hypothetical protein [Verrucomicrobiota bacterium]MCH8528905.1 hypothetical protein [Kiritimatiellia bacterium]